MGVGRYLPVVESKNKARALGECVALFIVLHYLTVVVGDVEGGNSSVTPPRVYYTCTLA